MKRERFRRKSARQSYVSPFTVLESGEDIEGDILVKAVLLRLRAEGNIDGDLSG